MWRFSRSTGWFTTRNFCGEFHRPSRTEIFTEPAPDTSCLANFRLSLRDETRRHCRENLPNKQNLKLDLRSQLNPEN